MQSVRSPERLRLRSRARWKPGRGVVTIRLYVMTAAIGASLWTWVIVDSQLETAHVAALVISEALAFSAGRPLEKWLKNRKGKT